MNWIGYVFVSSTSAGYGAFARAPANVDEHGQGERRRRN